MNQSKIILNGAGWWIFTYRTIDYEEIRSREIVWAGKNRQLNLWSCRSYFVMLTPTVIIEYEKTPYRPLRGC